MIAESKKDKGRIGLSLAIAYFGCNGYTVSLPLNDTQDYDLVIDKDNCLSRVSVKFTGYKPKTSYSVDLRSCGGSNGSIVYSNFATGNVEYLFVVTELLELYFIPRIAITTNTMISLSEKYDKWRVEM